MTSKTVKEAVDKLCPPAVVRWSWSFWKGPTTQKTKKHAELNDTAAEKLAFVFRQLAALTARCRITKINFGPFRSWLNDGGPGHPCRINGQDAVRLAEVLAQCAALARLNLSSNGIGAGGAKSLAGVLAQCTALVQLDLSGYRSRYLSSYMPHDYNRIGDAGAESLAGVLGQCPALAYLDLRGNSIEVVEAHRIRWSLPKMMLMKLKV
jgi:hypothetical protein